MSAVAGWLPHHDVFPNATRSARKSPLGKENKKRNARTDTHEVAERQETEGDEAVDIKRGGVAGQTVVTSHAWTSERARSRPLNGGADGPQTRAATQQKTKREEGNTAWRGGREGGIERGGVPFAGCAAVRCLDHCTTHHKTSVGPRATSPAHARKVKRDPLSKTDTRARGNVVE